MSAYFIVALHPYLCIISLHLHNTPQGSKQQQYFTGAETKVQRGLIFPKCPQCKFCISNSKTHMLLLIHTPIFLQLSQVRERIKAPMNLRYPRGSFNGLPILSLCVGKVWGLLPVQVHFSIQLKRQYL